jgi:hypothetical protein
MVQMLALSCIACFAAAPQRPDSNSSDSARKAIEAFCGKDFTGSRLSTDRWEAAIAPLVQWKAEMEPGWDTMMIVSSYVVGSVEQKGEVATCSVQYKLLGEIAGREVRPRSGDETVVFTLQRSGSRWLVASPMIQPHVSVQTARTNFNELLREAQPESKDHAELEKLLKAIASLVGS